MANVKPMIGNVEWLSAEDRKNILEDNAKAVFKLAVEKATTGSSAHPLPRGHLTLRKQVLIF